MSFRFCRPLMVAVLVLPLFPSPTVLAHGGIGAVGALGQVVLIIAATSLAAGLGATYWLYRVSRSRWAWAWLPVCTAGATPFGVLVVTIVGQLGWL